MTSTDMLTRSDFTVWRDTYGEIGVGALADGDNDGVVGVSDFFLWQINFGGSLDNLEPALPGSGPVLALDLIRDSSSRPVLDANGKWQFSLSIIPDTGLFADILPDDPDKGTGGSTVIELGVQINDEHGFANTVVSNLSATASGQLFEDDPTWDGNAIDSLGLNNPGISPYGGLVDSQGVDAVGHQIDAFLGTIFFNSDNGGMGNGYSVFQLADLRPTAALVDSPLRSTSPAATALLGSISRETDHLHFPDASDFLSHTVEGGRCESRRHC